MNDPNLQPIDLVIIQQLQKDARITNKELARAAGIAESTCLERVRSLRRREIILGWHADLDLTALGRPIRALIHVRLQPKTTASVRAFQSDLLGCEETLTVRTISGADDFILEVAVPDVNHLRDFVLDKVTNRHDVVDARTSLVYEFQRNFEIGSMAELPADRPPERPDRLRPGRHGAP